MSVGQTIDKPHEMRPTAMAKAFGSQRESGGFDEIPFAERFSMLVDDEWDSRRVNKRISLLKTARFSAPEANVADIRYDGDRGLDKSQILELSDCGWVKAKRSIVITGASGAGKTWIACALGVAACSSFHSESYARLPEMIDELVAERDEEWLTAKKKHIKCDVLIIDDWLLEAARAKGAREILEIVESRQRQRSSILCSQFALSAWHPKFGEGAIADAVIDR